MNIDKIIDMLGDQVHSTKETLTIAEEGIKECSFPGTSPEHEELLKLMDRHYSQIKAAYQDHLEQCVKLFNQLIEKI